MASAWGPADEVDLWEQKLLGTKKKDFWILIEFCNSGKFLESKFSTSKLVEIFQFYFRIGINSLEPRIGNDFYLKPESLKNTIPRYIPNRCQNFQHHIWGNSLSLPMEAG